MKYTKKEHNMTCNCTSSPELQIETGMLVAIRNNRVLLVSEKTFDKKRFRTLDLKTGLSYSHLPNGKSAGANHELDIIKILAKGLDFTEFGTATIADRITLFKDTTFNIHHTIACVPAPLTLREYKIRYVTNEVLVNDLEIKMSEVIILAYNTDDARKRFYALAERGKSIHSITLYKDCD